MEIAVLVVVVVLALAAFAGAIGLYRRAETQRRSAPGMRAVRMPGGAAPDRDARGRGAAGAAGAVQRLAVGGLVALDHQSLPVVGALRRETVHGDRAAAAHWCLDAGSGVGTIWLEVDGEEPASVTVWRHSPEGVEALAGRAPGEPDVRWRDALWPRVARGEADVRVEGEATATGPAPAAPTGRVTWSEHRYPGAGNRRLRLERGEDGTDRAWVGEVVGVRSVDVHPPLERADAPG